jgi:hypothetical protein
VEWVVREGWGQGGEMTQALYAHVNNKRKKILIDKLKKKKRKSKAFPWAGPSDSHLSFQLPRRWRLGGLKFEAILGSTVLANPHLNKSQIW